MNFGIRVSILAAVMGGSFLAGVAQSATQVDTGAGSQSGSFLVSNPSVRLASLGGDQVAATGGAADFFSNPAALAYLDSPEIWFAHHASLFDTNNQTVVLGLPIRGNGLAFSGRYFDYGSIARTKDVAGGDPVNDSSFRPSTFVGTIGAGRGVFQRRLTLGMDFKSWVNHLDRTTSSGWAVDVGAIAPSIYPRLSAGVALRHLGPAVQGNPLPVTADMGFSYRLSGYFEKISLLMDAQKQRAQKSALLTGVEWSDPRFSLRLGYRSKADGAYSVIDRLSLGAAMRIKAASLEYAWTQGGTFEDQQRISFGFQLGPSAEDKKISQRQIDDAIRDRMTHYATEHVRLAEAARDRADWSLALNEYNVALVWAPSDENIQASLVQAKQMLDKEKISALFQQGLAYKQQGRTAEAVQAFKNLLALSPSDTEAKQELEKLERLSSAIAQRPALVVKRDGVVIDQTRAESLLQQAFNLYRLGDLDKTIDTCKKVLAIDPDNGDAKWMLQKLASNDNGAKENLDKTARLVEMLNVSALRAYSEGDLTHAQTIWAEALKLDPHNLQIKNNVTRVQSEMALKGQRP